MLPVSSDQFDKSTYSYDFNNISAMMNYYNRTIGEDPEDLVYYLIPVDATITTTAEVTILQVAKR